MSYIDYSFQTECVDKMLTSNVGQITLPTGSGKSIIQGNYIERMIAKSNGFGIYVIATPRILLTNQLMESVVKNLAKKHLPVKRITVHSGKEANIDLGEFESQAAKIDILRQINYISPETSTSTRYIKKAVDDANIENVPVLICATYHSVDRVYSALWKEYTVDALLCDESQYVVREDFHKAVSKVKQISDNTFFFTATRKETGSDNGLGHNNEVFYGSKTFFTCPPRDLIDSGVIVRPRMQLTSINTDRASGTAELIISAYKQHKGTINGNPKVLVVCRGSGQLKEILESTKFKVYARNQGDSFNVYDASSEFGFNVNGKAIKREDFIKSIRDHAGSAIIFHIDMLGEGIDISDMSAVLPLSDLRQSKFLQTLGRATRLHHMDRKSFTDMAFKPTDLDMMVKPYAYVIVPIFDDDDDIQANIRRMIYQLRDHGFDPKEDVVINKKIGVGCTDPIDLTTAPDKNNYSQSLYNTLFEIHHTIEDERIASLISQAKLDESDMSESVKSNLDKLMISEIVLNKG